MYLLNNTLVPSRTEKEREYEKGTTLFPKNCELKNNQKYLSICEKYFSILEKDLLD